MSKEHYFTDTQKQSSEKEGSTSHKIRKKTKNSKEISKNSYFNDLPNKGSSASSLIKGFIENKNQSFAISGEFPDVPNTQIMKSDFPLSVAETNFQKSELLNEVISHRRGSRGFTKKRSNAQRREPQLKNTGKSGSDSLDEIQQLKNLGVLDWNWCEESMFKNQNIPSSDKSVSQKSFCENVLSEQDSGLNHHKFSVKPQLAVTSKLGALEIVLSKNKEKSILQSQSVKKLNISPATAKSVTKIQILEKSQFKFRQRAFTKNNDKKLNETEPDIIRPIDSKKEISKSETSNIKEQVIEPIKLNRNIAKKVELHSSRRIKNEVCTKPIKAEEKIIENSTTVLPKSEGKKQAVELTTNNEVSSYDSVKQSEHENNLREDKSEIQQDFVENESEELSICEANRNLLRERQKQEINKEFQERNKNAIKIQAYYRKFIAMHKLKLLKSASKKKHLLMRLLKCGDKSIYLVSIFLQTDSLTLYVFMKNMRYSKDAQNASFNVSSPNPAVLKAWEDVTQKLPLNQAAFLEHFRDILTIPNNQEDLDSSKLAEFQDRIPSNNRFNSDPSKTEKQDNNTNSEEIEFPGPENISQIEVDLMIKKE